MLCTTHLLQYIDENVWYELLREYAFVCCGITVYIPERSNVFSVPSPKSSPSLLLINDRNEKAKRERLEFEANILT